MKSEILENWIVLPKETEIKRFGSGHIHQTYLITVNHHPAYILQKLNTSIFGHPEVISKNIDLASAYLNIKAPEYRFPGTLPTREGKPLLSTGGEYWRLTRFIENSYSPDVLQNPEQAFEAARAFGNLSRLLDGITMDGFGETIPHFHNLSFRYTQFEKALLSASAERRAQARELVEFYQMQKSLVKTFDKISSENLFPKRIQHHDTKINNVLLDKNTQKALTVCDLDTLMPGYFISDLGDMIRTYTSAESEDSTSWEGISVRPDYMKSLLQGYLSEMGEVLSESERHHLSYAGEFMIYMQGLRFLTDYLNGDIYYPVRYDLHNFDRARNQMILLKDYQQNYPADYFEEILKLF